VQINDNKENIVVYTTAYCPYCVRVMGLLEKKGANFQQVDIDDEPEISRQINQVTRQSTFPQVFVGDRYIGNCDELFRLDRAGELDGLLGLK